jgi:apolipoprotein N-acyltransferase
VTALGAAVALALGALQTLALVVTDVWWLPWLTTAALVLALDHSASARRAALLGWAYGFGWLAAGTWWLFVSLYRYGHLPAPLAALAVAALAAALSLYLALAAALYRRWRYGGAGDALLFAALWLLAELARGALFSGFPWAGSAYTQIDGPLAALAPWVGAYGMGAALAGLSAGLVRAAHARGRGRLIGGVGAVLVVVVAGALGPGQHTQPGQTLSVQLLQPNVAQDEKFALERMADTLQWVALRLIASPADLVVAPETAVPLLPADLETFAPGYWATLQQRFGAVSPQSALIGVPLGDFQYGYTNSVVGLGPGAPYRYDKLHLVPFGEFVPAGFRWFTDALRIPLGDFQRGAPAQPSFAVKGERAAPNICYEDLFGEELAARFADPGNAPTLYVNVSNIGWFGDTIAVEQHLNISRLRALEFQRPMLRATNTGATAVIDHQGRVRARLPAFSAGMLDGQVQGRHGLTPYAAWASRAGLWPLVALALATVVAAAALSARRAANGRGALA